MVDKTPGVLPEKMELLTFKIKLEGGYQVSATDANDIRNDNQNG